jgi:hypothetical protein
LLKLELEDDAALYHLQERKCIVTEGIARYILDACCGSTACMAGPSACEVRWETKQADDQALPESRFIDPRECQSMSRAFIIAQLESLRKD